MLLSKTTGRGCGSLKQHGTCSFSLRCPPRQQQRLVPRAAASSYGHGYDGLDARSSKSNLPTQDVDAPSATVRSIIDTLAENDLDGLIPYIPDEVLDVIMAQRKLRGRASGTTYQDIVLASTEDVLHLDTYAVRNLIYRAPLSIQPLSSVTVSSDRYLQRCALVSPEGEECIVTFTLTKQECLESQYKAAPVLKKRWMLRSIIGEFACEELPAHPSPSFPPEAVVQAQLYALRENNIPAVFAFASPANKAAVGPIQRFAALLQHSSYEPLMRHAEATTLQQAQPDDNTYVEVVSITPRSVAAGPSKRAAPASPMLFVWVVRRQPEDAIFAGCWMTDSVHVFQGTVKHRQSFGPNA